MKRTILLLAAFATSAAFFANQRRPGESAVVTHCASRLSSQTYVVGDESGRIRLYAAGLVAVKKVSERPIVDLFFAPSAGVLVARDRTKTVKLLDPKTLALRFTHTGIVRGLALDGRTLVSVESKDRGTKFESRVVVHSVGGQSLSQVSAITISTRNPPDIVAICEKSRRLCLASQPKEVQVFEWDDEGVSNLAQARIGTGTFERIDMSPSGARLAVLTGLGDVFICGVDGLTTEFTLHSHDRAIRATCLSFAGEDRLLVGTSRGQVLSIEQGEIVAYWKIPQEHRVVALWAEGKNAIAIDTLGRRFSVENKKGRRESKKGTHIDTGK